MVAVVSCDGDLERALEQLQDEEGEERLLGLRADAEFLSTNGLLMRFVVWESEQSAPE